jgi:hypothetical protein
VAITQPVAAKVERKYLEAGVVKNLMNDFDIGMVCSDSVADDDCSDGVLWLQEYPRRVVCSSRLKNSTGSTFAAGIPAIGVGISFGR